MASCGQTTSPTPHPSLPSRLRSFLAGIVECKRVVSWYEELQAEFVVAADILVVTDMLVRVQEVPPDIQGVDPDSTDEVARILDLSSICNRGTLLTAGLKEALPTAMLEAIASFETNEFMPRLKELTGHVRSVCAKVGPRHKFARWKHLML